MNHRTIIAILLAVVAALGGRPAGACSVPVFRYALERWPADSYLALIFHRGPLGEKDQAVVQSLKTACDDANAPVNLQVQTVDLAETVPPKLAKLLEKRPAGAGPWLAVLGPQRAKNPDQPLDETLVYSGPLEQAAAKRLLNSPRRRQLTRLLLQGNSVVWLLLESGSKDKDDAAEKTLTKELAAIEKAMAMKPAEANDPPADGVANIDVSPGVPLRIAFAVLRLPAGEPAEREFLATLDGLMSGVKHDGPLALPVYGRGRALTVVSGEDISADGIEQVTDFLTGDCSCQVKGLNPGIDLLLTADWDAALAGATLTDKPLPDLTGVLPGAATSGPAASGLAASRAASQAGEAKSAPPRGGGSIVYTVAWCLLAGVIIVAAVSMVIVRRKKREGA